MIAWIFPGQGSQFAGMDAGLSSHASGETFAVAADVLGWDVREACAGGSDRSLDATEVSQPAIFTVSVAVARTLEAAGVFPDAVAGHSVGEFAALVAAHAISFEDALHAVAVRAEAMAQAGIERPGGMAAVLGLSLDAVERLCSEAPGTVGVASVNAPAQLVISGERGAVDAVSGAARDAGARRVIPLSISVAAHSELMAPAASRLERALERVSMLPPIVPFVSCVSGSPEDDPAEIARLLCRALTHPVRWVDAVRSLGGVRASRFIEVGPGRVLSGLVRSIIPEASVTGVGDDDAIALLTPEMTGPSAR